MVKVELVSLVWPPERLDRWREAKGWLEDNVRNNYAEAELIRFSNITYPVFLIFLHGQDALAFQLIYQDLVENIHLVEQK